MAAASPIVWEHYLVLLIIPVIALAAAAIAGRASRRAKLAMLAACVLVFVIPLLRPILPQSGAATILAEYGVAVLVLVYLSAWWLVRDRAAPSRTRIAPRSLGRGPAAPAQSRAPIC